jgi:hypothetical protein
MVPVSRKSERIKINIRVSMSDEIARCLGLGRQVDSSRLVRIHSVGMRNNAILFDQFIIRK